MDTYKIEIVSKARKVMHTIYLNNLVRACQFESRMAARFKNYATIVITA